MNKPGISDSSEAATPHSETSTTNSTTTASSSAGWSKEALEGAMNSAQENAQYQEGRMGNFVHATPSDEPAFVGNSRMLRAVFELIRKVANTDSTVLILGESGTGKELVARALHNQSNRRSKPFVPVNCGAIPSELLESELFGHVKGSFTGAHASRVGRFTLAHQGTLFLDEIGTMPASLQVKILRALQQREFEPVGGNKTMKSDCRVIAATNNDLELEVARGNFREDLFYRLNVIPISLPALRERREDIPLLISHFIHQFNVKKGYAVEGPTEEALETLVRYNWPGNVRELENICQRMCILKGEGRISLEDIPSKIRQARPAQGVGTPWSGWLTEGIPESGIPFDELVADFENDLIMKALEQTRWNKNKAAQLLRLNRTTLVEKIKKRGLVPTGA